MEHECPILVTGAGRRVGLHVLNRLVERGYSVIAHYRTKTDAVVALERRGIGVFYADLNEPESVLQMTHNIRQAYTGLRGILHNASAFEVTQDTLQAALVQYQLFFQVHMVAPYIINTELQPLLAKSVHQPADIIHITDIYAERPNPMYDIYCSTKAGLANLTKSLAKSLAPGIKVNAIAPGPILFLETHSAAYRQAVLDKTPLQVEGSAEAIYLAVQSLLDNPFMTGSTITVDGGRFLSE